MTTSRRHLLLIPALALTAVSLVGCSGGAFADAWSVTYQVTLSGADHSSTSVSYLAAPQRGAISETVSVENNPATKSQDATTSVYSVVAQVTAKEIAKVTLTPAPGTTATCEILLDGTRSIAKNTAAAGQPVTCEVDTPAFDKK